MGMTRRKPNSKARPTITKNSVLVDGTKIGRSARQAPRALLFHDRPTASELLERRLVAAGTLMGIDVVDHIILGDVRYCSFKEMGKI